MELLGSYNSQLTPSYYQQLLALLDAAITAGDLSAGSAFNKSTLLALEQQAQSFSQLPTGNAGTRVTRRFAQLGTAQTTSLSSRGPVCHHPDPLPANRPGTGLTPVCSGLCARLPAPGMAPVLPCPSSLLHPYCATARIQGKAGRRPPGQRLRFQPGKDGESGLGRGKH